MNFKDEIKKVFPGAFDYVEQGKNAIAKIPSARGWDYLTISDTGNGFRVGTRCWGKVGTDLNRLLNQAEFPKHG